MSKQAKVDLMSSAEAAKQNFTTDNVKHGGCKACNCQLFIRYHYDDGQPIADANLELIDSTDTKVEAKTDKNGLCKVDQMGCGSYKLMLGEGSDEFSPQLTLVNNPSLQVDPKYAAVAGEYFSLYTILNRQELLTYDADDSSDSHIDVDSAWFKSIPDQYQPAYQRFWQLYRQINSGPLEQRKAVHKIHSSLAAEVAGHTKSNEAVLLMCQVILGCVPVVGQAMDLYFLGDWCWETYEGKDDAWHWANGALILVGFIPGLGDALKTTGQSVLKALKASDKAAVQLGIKMIRSLSNGNVVKFLSSFAGHLSSYIQKASELLESIIHGLSQTLKNSDSWLLRLVHGVFESLIKVIQKLNEKLTQLETWINSKIEEFIPKVLTVKTGKPKRESAKRPEDVDAGKVDPHQTEKEIGGQASEAENATANTQKVCKNGEPVDMNTGKVFESRQDFILPGYLSLNHERYFHSCGRRDIGLMGRAWRSSWDVCLEMTDDTVTFVDKDYTTAIFPIPMAEGEATRSALQPQWRLFRNNQDFVLYHKSGVRYHFGYALGSTVRLTAITDSYGHQVTFLYELGTLKWVVLADNNLIQVSTDHNRITALALLTPERQLIKPLASYHYDKQGRLIKVRAGEGCNFDYQYTPQGYLKRWQDLAYTWVEHDYDEQGRAIATRCSGHFWNDKISYDNDANITYYTSAFGGVSEYHRDEQNHLIAIVDPDGHRTEQQWELDNLIAVTDPTGATTEYIYDDWGNMTEAKLPDGSVHHYEYDDWGRPILYTDPLGSQWHYDYNVQGELTQVTDPLGRQWHYDYDDQGQRTQSTAPDGVTTAYQYNPYGLLAAVKPQVGLSYEFIYDQQYRLIERRASNQTQRRWFYDQHQSQPERVVYEDGSSTQFEYDVEGNLTTIIDAAGNRHQYQYGPFDRLLRSVDPMGASTRYHYNPEAEFAGVTNSQKNSWQFDFNPSGQLVSEQHYDGRKELYHYDEAGRVREHIKPDGIRRLFQYDALGQVIGIEHRNAEDELLSASDYRYDAAGRLISAENDDAKVEFVYNAAGQVVQEIVNGEALTSDYDESGIRSQLSGAITARQLSYQQGQLSQLKLGEHDPLNFAYTPEGFEQYRDNGQGFALHQQWSPTGLLQSQKLGFQHDHPERVDDKLTLRNYHYDNLDQLIGIDDPYWGNQQFTLTPNGQISEVRRQDRNDNQQLQRTLFGYDSELNLNAKAHTTDNIISLTDERLKVHKTEYDRAGRVLKLRNNQYQYDECGRLVEKIEAK
ncbi:DUF6531 domain-containing protein, partial [Celerinatantimonas sp. YJH-8]|uniref:DUF6531 domain-containing protein n=1 Tax=Celerinatantimonas sp. YJH-8 TaxID=3228714 RepID=UPI0038C6B263